MGLRVHKRIKIAKGVHLNVGKKGMSVSAKVGNTTLNSKGRVTTRLAPGISYSTNLKPKKGNNTAVQPIGGDAEIKVKAKNKYLALVLCIFLGWFGVHKFYEGKIGIGIIYLLTFGVGGIGIIVDVIKLLTKPNPYY